MQSVLVMINNTVSDKKVSARFVRNSKTNKILLEVTGIEAETMDKVITIEIDGFGTIKFCGNDFARLLTNSSEDTMKTFGTALYLYGEEAKACFGNTGA